MMLFRRGVAATRKRARTHEKGSVSADVPGHNGARPTNTVDAPTKGIALDINEKSAAGQSMLSKLQESTGFAKDILTRVEEDVWNGL